MTVLISANLTDLILKFKAPRGMMYFVEGINFATVQADGIYITVHPFAIDATFNIDVSTRQAIASFSASIAGTNHFIGGINEKSKFLSIAKASVQTVDVSIEIYGELVKASRTELIMEWFRRGK